MRYGTGATLRSPTFQNFWFLGQSSVAYQLWRDLATISALLTSSLSEMVPGNRCRACIRAGKWSNTFPRCVRLLPPDQAERVSVGRDTERSARGDLAQRDPALPLRRVGPLSCSQQVQMSTAEARAHRHRRGDARRHQGAAPPGGPGLG